ncbi:MAG: glycosyl hydrolase [candidate division FCPU426 bacterium]
MKSIFLLLGLGILSSQVEAAGLRPADRPLSKPVAFQPSVKRGVGHYSSPWDEASKERKDSLLASSVDELRLAWYYNWVLSPSAMDQGVKAGFVPMAWDHQHMQPDLLAKLKAKGYPALLGFNEPGHPGQAQMTVAQTLDLWPKLEATGMRLGSPAPADAKWLDDFMPQAIQRGLRVDFVALHSYPDTADTDGVEVVRALVRKYWKKYNRPIWLTEYSLPIFAWHQHAPTMEENAWFARDSCLMLESLPYVERYAWFSTGPGAAEGTGNDGYAPTALYVSKGVLSPAGIAYRDAMLRPDHGLHYKVYPGTFKDFSETKGMKAKSEGRVVGFDLWADNSEGDAAIEFNGYLELPRDGYYEFTLSDPASALYLGKTKVGRPRIGLAKGRHKFRVTALRQGEHPGLRVTLRGPEMKRQGIPLDALFLP